MSVSIPFEVESTMETGGEAYVLAHALGPVAPSRRSTTSTLGGCALLSWQLLPRGTAEWGQHADRALFRLAIESDRACFAVGQHVTLDSHEIAPGPGAA